MSLALEEDQVFLQQSLEFQGSLSSLRPFLMTTDPAF
jgi:hypothetical protein